MVASRLGRCRAFALGIFTGALLVVAACGETSPESSTSPSVAPSPSVFVDELALHAGKVCPKRLPTGDDPNGYGFGTDERATAAPTFGIPDEGWVCLYNPTDGPRQPNGDAFFTWIRSGSATPVGESLAAELFEQVGELAPPTDWEARVCPANLGPRWMLVLSTQGDLTGVVIDDYGCNDVRLTDEPFKTAPGEAEAMGTVPGVLDVRTCLSCTPINQELLGGLTSAHQR